MSKRQHNFSPRSYIWAQVSGTHLANSHQGAPTLYLFQFQTHFYILTFTNYLHPNYRHISTFLHSSIIYIPITDIFLHFYTFQLFLSQFQANVFPYTPLSIPATFQHFRFINCFSPEVDTCLHLCNRLCIFHTEVYISQCIFSPGTLFLSKLSPPLGILTARG